MQSPNALHLQPNEGTLARLASAQSLAGYFSTNVEVNLDVPRTRPA